MNPANPIDITQTLIHTTNCPHCQQLSPEKMVSNFVENTAKAIHQFKPSVPVMAWPYSANRWSKDPYQIDFIEKLPSSVALLSEIDKDQWIKKNGYSKLIWDYSIDFVGPSDRILGQVETAQECNVEVFIKSETALGLEINHVPYVPCLPRLLTKWKNLAQLHPRGVIQSWAFFGMWGSIAEELGWWKCWEPSLSNDEILYYIATREVGEKNQKQLIKVWEDLSEAISHLPCIPPYYIGPFFLGPAHPLITKGNPIPDVFLGALYYKQELEESLSTKRLQLFEPLILTQLPSSPKEWGFIADSSQKEWEIFFSELEQVVHFSAQAFHKIQSIVSDNQENMFEQATIIEFLYRTFITTYNSLRFLYLQTKEINSENRNNSSIITIIQEELQNTQAVELLYQRSPWLDLQLRTEGKFSSSQDMINTKIRLLKELLYNSTFKL
jgi:hypothetical protein